MGIFGVSENDTKSWEDHATPLKNATSIACDSQKGIVLVGSAEGHFARSADGGQAWQDIDSRQDMNIASLARINDEKWAAVGGDGLVFVSDDDGLTWSASQAMTNNNLWRIKLIDGLIVAVGDKQVVLAGNQPRTLQPTSGFPFSIKKFMPAMSGHLLAYAAGGDILSLDNHHAPVMLANVGTYHDINAAVFSSSTHTAWIVTNFGHIFSSQDGLSWAEVHGPPKSNPARVDYVSIDASKDGKTLIVAASDHSILITQDSGSHWHAAAPLNFTATTVNLLGQNIIAGGAQNLRVSNDLGGHWGQPSIKTQEALIAGVHDDEGTIVLVGTNGDILQSTDFGGHWADPGRDTKEQNTLQSVACLRTCDTLIAAGDGGASWQSTDRGRDWHSLSQPASDYLDLRWFNNSLNVLTSDGSLFTAVNVAAPWTGAISDDIATLARGKGGLWLLTSDGKIDFSANHSTWSAVQAPVSSTVNAISPSILGDDVYLVGDKGLIAFSQDPLRPGSPFQIESTPGNIAPSLKTIYRMPDSILIAGDGGTILRSAGSQHHWQQVPTPVSNKALLAITADDGGNNIWVVGEGGTILYSKDHGTSWAEQHSPARDIDWNAAAVAQTFWGPRLLVFGSRGTLIVSDDFGRHWYSHTTPRGEVQAAIFVKATGQVWAVTSDGFLLTSADYGDNWDATDLHSPGNVSAVVADDSGHTLYIAGDSGFTESATYIGPRYTPRDFQEAVVGTHLKISFTLSDSLFTHDPDITLRIARGSEHASGTYQTLAVSSSSSDTDSGRHFDLTSSIEGINPQAGELFWVTPCLNWTGSGRCIPLKPFTLVPLVDLKKHVVISIIVGVVCLLCTVQTILLWLSPYSILYIYDFIKTIEDLVRDKIPYGAWLARLNSLFFVPVFAFSGRTLDAWITKHGAMLQSSRDNWATYSPLPIEVDLDGTTVHISKPGPATLTSCMDEREIAIVGPGGVGKTTLAREFTLWLGGDNDLTRRIRVRPVCLFVGDGAEDLLKVVKMLLQEKLKKTVDSDLVTALLRKGRLIVVLDGVSERSQVVQSYLRDLRSTIFARFIITTSRLENDRAYAGARVKMIRPLSLNSESLLSFMLALISRKDRSGQDPLAQMDVQLQLATRLAALVQSSQVGVTPLLVQTFVAKAEQLLKSGLSLDDLPTTVLGAYLGYIRDLTSRSAPGIGQRELMKCLMFVASLCLGDDCHPRGVDIEVAIRALEQRTIDVSLLDSLLNLGLLISTPSLLGSEIRFALDPVAEYCAAVFWWETLDRQRWCELKERARANLPGASGFVQAFKDVDAAYEDDTRQAGNPMEMRS